MAEVKDKIWYLQRTGLFGQLSHHDLVRLAALAELDQVLTRDALFVPGEPDDRILLLKAGCIRLSRVMPDGRKLTLAYLQPGDVFGELGGASDGRHESVAEAAEPSIVCLFGRTAFEAFLSGHPAVCLAIAKRLNLRVRRIEIRLQDLVFLDVRSRVLKALEALCDDFGVMTRSGKRLGMRLTHQDVADLVGATRETTTTALGDLIRSGALAVEGKTYLLPHPEGTASPGEMSRTTSMASHRPAEGR